MSIEYLQNIFEIKTDNKIFDNNPNPSFSINIDTPKFTLGFQHYIHQSKLKLNMLDQFKGKKKVYNIMNQFETKIDDYDKTIMDISNKYFDDKLSVKTFYQLWETFFLFDLIDINMDGYKTVLLDSSNDDILKSVILFREQFGKKNKNDKYYNVSTSGEQYKNKYKKSKDNVKVSNSIGKDKVNLIITNAIKNVDDSVTQEQNIYKLILNQIIFAVNNSDDGGHLLLKVYETYTNVMSKIIAALGYFYEKLFIVKPLFSRNSNAEKYIVCYGFKKGSVKYVNKLVEIVEKYDKNKYLVDIFPDYVLGENFKNSLIVENMQISGYQYVNINEIITFINKQNYRGTEYDTRRQMQIDATIYWESEFLPNAKDYGNKKKHLEGVCAKIIEGNNIKVDKLTKEFQFKN